MLVWVPGLACSTPAGPAAGTAHVECPTEPLPRSIFEYNREEPAQYRDSLLGTAAGIETRQFTFASPGGGSASGVLFRPASVSGRLAGVIMVHGLSGSALSMSTRATATARLGAVVMSLDAPITRLTGPYRITFTPMDSVLQVELIRELQRAVDILAARSDVDAARLAYVGYSYGGAMGALFAGVERRLRTFVLISADGGLLTHFAKPRDASSPLRGVSDSVARRWVLAMTPIEPICWVHRAPPASVFLQNGRSDDLVPRADAEQLFSAALEPKRIVWYDAGHNQGAQGQRDFLEWLHRAIGINEPQ